ncbi:MAG: hypothetical protein ACOYKJ_03610 [Candidatus Howiella sp.]
MYIRSLVFYCSAKKRFKTPNFSPREGSGNRNTRRQKYPPSGVFFCSVSIWRVFLLLRNKKRFKTPNFSPREGGGNRNTRRQKIPAVGVFSCSAIHGGKKYPPSGVSFYSASIWRVFLLLRNKNTIQNAEFLAARRARQPKYTAAKNTRRRGCSLIQPRFGGYFYCFCALRGSLHDKKQAFHVAPPASGAGDRDTAAKNIRCGAYYSAFGDAGGRE